LKTCLTCGARFTATGPNHRYCSRDCRPSRGVEYPGGRRTCAACGTAFTRTNFAQRYCGPSCRPSNQADYPQRKYVERVGRPLKPRGVLPDLVKRARVTALREAGMKLSEIAAKMGVTPSAVSIMLTTLKREKAAAGGVTTESSTALPA
jgi:hypothetical protein